MEKNTAGISIILVLAVILITGWITGHNGILTGTVLTIIGLISGAIFGFEYGKLKFNTDTIE